MILRYVLQLGAAGLSLLFGGLLLLAPEAVRQGIRTGLELCLSSVLPSLFPFFVLSSLLPDLGFSAFLGRLLAPLMGRLFHLSGAGAGALAMGLLGGYPAGARAVSELYEKKLCSRAECERLLAFCNNCGPAFFLSFVGEMQFGSVLLGAQLWLIHVLAAFLTGILLRPKEQHRTQPVCRSITRESPVSLAFVRAVQSGFSAFLSVSGFVLLFSALLQPLRTFDGTGLLTGLIELFSGIAALPQGKTGFVAAAFLTGFGGLSVHAQSMAFFLPAGLSGRWYFRGKLLQAALSAALAAALLLL